MILNIHKGSGGGKTKITQIVQSAPIYGPIAGCCGRLVALFEKTRELLHLREIQISQ